VEIKLHKVVGKTAEHVVSEMRRLALDDNPHQRLPGPSPVSLERKDIPKLKEGYVIAEKSDGVRFVMMFVRIDGIKLCLIVDRAMTIFLTPFRHIPRVLFQGTIFDGELTVDKQGNSTFVLFDAVIVAGVTVSQLPFAERIVAMQRSLKEFRASSEDPAILRFKRWTPLSSPDAQTTIASAEQLYHADGVILMPIYDPVVYGRHFNMFKLKPKGTHTVDFVLMAINGSIGIYDPDSKKNVEVDRAIMKSNQLFLIGSILECEYVDGRWHVVHWRGDKTFANDRLTYTKTLRNIAENIKVEELFV
jgi:hypothetical protein